MDTHHIETPRTARYHTIGDGTRAAEVWFLLHGYGQSAEDMLRRCEPLHSERRLLVAPEGLSRFYQRGGQGPVGASWMTREDRELEIADTLRYLDLLSVQLDKPATKRVHCVVGFSQGAAAACRWAGLGHTRFERLVLWGGGVPPDLDMASAQGRLRSLRLHLVRGDDDTIYDAAQLGRDSLRLAEHAIPHDCHPFDGDHRVDGDVLRAIADA